MNPSNQETNEGEKNEKVIAPNEKEGQKSEEKKDSEGGSCCGGCGGQS